MDKLKIFFLRIQPIRKKYYGKISIYYLKENHELEILNFTQYCSQNHLMKLIL